MEECTHYADYVHNCKCDILLKLIDLAFILEKNIDCLDSI